MNETKDLTTANRLRDTFLKLLRGQIGTGIYVWGGNGEILDEMKDPIGWILQHETSRENAQRVFRLYAKRVDDGVKPIRAFDCSGLVYWALKAIGVQRSDVSSRGLFALVKSIEENELCPGDLVFHHDGKQIVHVGVCDGEAQIECRGRDVGVVRNARKPGYWNRFGRLPAFAVEPQEVVAILGGSVRVREGDSVAARCVGIVHRGETYPLTGVGASGWYRILWRGIEVYITNKPQYTEVRRG